MRPEPRISKRKTEFGNLVASSLPTPKIIGRLVVWLGLRGEQLGLRERQYNRVGVHLGHLGLQFLNREDLASRRGRVTHP